MTLVDMRVPTAVLGKIGNLTVRIADDPKEIAAAQRLRYRIFAQELGARIDDASGEARDEDAFDAMCDHLVVSDSSITGSATDRIVGTYRLLRDDAVEAEGAGFSSAAEFDIAALVRHHPSKRFLELGRSCVLPDYRNKRTIELLWQGIWAYCLRHRIDVMAGCASIRGAVPAAHALPLSFLYHHARAKGGWDIRPASPNNAFMDMMPVEAINAKAALAAMPPLVKGYLRLGARFATTAVVDTVFGTTDVMVILPVDAIESRYLRHYGDDAGRFAPAA